MLSALAVRPATGARDVAEKEIKAIAGLAACHDTEAFGRLYRLYFSQVFTFISFRISNREDAEDLANTVFEKALAAISRYEPKPAQFSTWLYTIAKNCIIDHYRKRKIPIDADVKPENAAGVDPSADPERKVLLDERKRTLREALRELTPDQREVVECRFFFELSIQETAAAMLRTEGAVKALQFRALENLHRFLTEELLVSPSV
ncbi:MAG: sigma-70 family RNA polymerase sigma factor [Gaiellales bacterium]|nr:sigma-70 family RNA polymerase sigma factor [Gaiellales bacterium]